MSRVILSRPSTPLGAGSDGEGSPTQWRRGFLASLGMTLVFLPQLAQACPVCYGGAGSLAKGMDSAIWFLLAVLGFVQIGFVALFWSFWRRARELRRRREQFHLIGGGAR